MKVCCIVCEKKIKKKNKDICCRKCSYLYKMNTQLSILTMAIERLQHNLKEIQEKQEKQEIKYFNYQKENKSGSKKSNTNKWTKHQWKK